MSSRARRLLESLLEADGALTSQDVYNFYFLWWIHTQEPDKLHTQYGEHVLGEYLQSLRYKYITIFKKLLSDQLTKYAGLKRTDPDFDVSKTGVDQSPEILQHQAGKTYRTDMKRRNTVWNTVGEHLVALEHATAPDAIFVSIDRLNACVHNSGTLILGKVDDRLMQAYETAANSKPEFWQKYVDKDLRQLLTA